MQKQAAPFRFEGIYPNLHNIPLKFIPKELLPGLAKVNGCIDTLNISIAEKALTTMYNLKHQLDFPKLFMRIDDPEIKQLATNKNTKSIDFRLRNKQWIADFNTFDKINCEHIECSCKYLADYDYEQIYGNEPEYNNETAILYRSCKRTLFAAAKRQIKSAPVPDLICAQDFINFGKKKIDEYLGEYLDDFGYSYNQWYNHLNAAKQKNIDAIITKLQQYPDDIEEALKDPEFQKLLHYEGICKKEIQGPDGKPRMVCSIPDLIKYVMGPVCWKLEEIFTKHLPCYCGGMNLTEMEEKINHYIDEGFTLVAEGDGSAFDNTQDVMLKELDRYVYSRIADKIYHVPKSWFEYVSQQYYKVMDIVHVDPLQKKRKTLMQYAVLGTVFSGDCDTTLMNTMRMGLYNWYTNEKADLTFNRDYICFSKGDDFTVMYHYAYDCDLGRFRIQQAYKRYWLAKNKPDDPTTELDKRQYGIGQILKFIEFGPVESIKFCSLRAWVKDDITNHIYLTRNPEKFYNLAMFSRKTRLRNKKGLQKYLIEQAVALKTNYPKIQFFNMIVQKYYDAARQVCPATFKDCFDWVESKQHDRRKTLSLEVDNAFDKELFYYNKTPREEYYQIGDKQSYWETMQNIQRANYTELSDNEAKYINEQINSEFDPITYYVQY